uniref:RING-type domain-containing protein n=1 Tax=Globisporangium ultimum (strain ATCC 200006 / CBS 805.95 / DAOM BR144) TaxID=431595 RepID=K3X845_GLOUD
MASNVPLVPPPNPYEFTREEYNLLVSKTPNPQISKRSEYEEVELIEDCTLYDIYRQPRAPITDPSATKTLPVRVLNAELTCPICLGIIRNTMVVMECLHRFCGECIQKCLRLGNKECPSCRIHIPSKRSLRRDENFDALIKTIYPDLAEFERNEDKLIEEINRSRHFNNAFTESAKVGAQNQEKLRRQGGKKKLPSASNGTSSSSNGAATTNGGGGEKRSVPGSTSSSPSDGSSTNGSTSHSDDDEPARKQSRTTPPETSPAAPSSASSASSNSTPAPSASRTTTTYATVSIRLLLHPDEEPSAPKLRNNVFRTQSNLKIISLKKQIARFLSLPSTENLHILLSRKNCALSGLERSGAVIRKDLLFDQELEEYMTIEDVYQQYRMGTSWELLLLYHFSDTIINGVAQFISSGK